MSERGESLPVRVARLEDRVTAITEAINGGPSVQWKRSIRGRLHEVENIQRAADNIADAARELRRSNVMVPRSVFVTVAATCATLAALAAVVTAVVSYWP